MRPIPDDMYELVHEITLGRVMASEAGDEVLRESLYQRLADYYRSLKAQGALHPFVIEILADLTEDRREAIALYREALTASDEDEPRHTILLDMARRWIDLGDKKEGRRLLVEARHLALEWGDNDYAEEAKQELDSLDAPPGA